jgi:hypothetical protein
MINITHINTFILKNEKRKNKLIKFQIIKFEIIKDKIDIKNKLTIIGLLIVLKERV